MKFRIKNSAAATLCLLTSLCLAVLWGPLACAANASAASPSAASASAAPPAAGAAQPAATEPVTPDVDPADVNAAPPQDQSQTARGMHRHRARAGRLHDGHSLVSIGHNSTLGAGEHADSVVSVFGSSTSAGTVTDAVVSIFGNTRVTGTVGDAAVAVFGNTYIDSAVGGDVVAVLGGVVLGPHAEVGGNVVSIGGGVTRDPGAQLHGGVQNISFGMNSFDLGWFTEWVQRCLLYGKLLSFSPGLGWAWVVAFVSLGLYLLTALLFRERVEKCAQMMESHPGKTLLAALLSMLATPVLLVLLCVTVIGILAIPFVGLALLIADSFGRVVVLAWIGRRIIKPFDTNAAHHAVLTVFIGGLVVLALYLVPVVGIIVYKLIGIMGLGIVIYAAIEAARAHRAAAPPGGGGALGVQIPSPTAPGDPTGIGHAGAAASTPGAASTPSAATAVTALAYPRAGFWIRMGALFIDVVLVSVILHWIIQTGHLHLVLLAAYGAVMWRLRGATVGGIICHLHVVRLDGRELDWATAMVRALSCFLSLAIAGLGFIWIAIDDERQAWHDKIAGTVVVQLPRGVSLV